MATAFRRIRGFFASLMLALLLSQVGLAALVQPVSAAEAEGALETAGVAGRGEQVVEFTFEDAEVGDVFRILADVGGMNFIADGSVAGKATFSISGLPVERAIDLVARTLDLGYVIVDNTLIVGSKDRIAGAFTDSFTGITTQEQELVAILQQLAELGGFNLIVGEGIKGMKLTAVLDRSNPRETVELLAESLDLVTVWKGNTLFVSRKAGSAELEEKTEPTYLRTFSISYADPGKTREFLRLALDESQIHADSVSRTIAVVGTAAEQEIVQNLLADIDQAPAQVFIEARVQEVSRDAMRNLGVRWSKAELENISFGQLELEAEDLIFVLEGLEEHGHSRLLATPQITTISGKTASIFIGDRVPVILHGGEGVQDTIEYIEAGVNLEITPYITPDGAITTTVKPEVASIVDWTAQEVPQIRTRKAQTTVRVRDGQPIVIGGLIKQEERENMERVPLLGQLPILGALFRQSEGESTQMETVIFLIPHLVQEQGGLQGQDGSRWAEERSRKLEKMLDELNHDSSSHAVKLDVAGLRENLAVVEFEKIGNEKAALYTKLGRNTVCYDGLDSRAWTVGVGVRSYAATQPFPLWASLGIEGLWMDNSAAQSPSLDRSYLVGVTEVGVKGGKSEGAFLEPYLRFSHIFAGEQDEKLTVPQYDGPVFGLRIGYSF